MFVMRELQYVCVCENYNVCLIHAMYWPTFGDFSCHLFQVYMFQIKLIIYIYTLSGNCSKDYY